MPRVQLRRGTAAQWTQANPVLAEGEPGLELDTKKTKHGDGVTTWKNLPYSVGEVLRGPPGAPGKPGEKGKSGADADMIKCFTLEAPVSGDNFTIAKIPVGQNITRIYAIKTGGTSVMWTLKHGSNRAAGTEVVNGGVTTISESTIAQFNSPVINAEDYLWIEIIAVSGSVTEFSITVQF